MTVEHGTPDECRHCGRPITWQSWSWGDGWYGNSMQCSENQWGPHEPTGQDSEEKSDA